MKSTILIASILLIVNAVSAQSIAETVQNLSGQEYSEYIKENFYTIRSQNMDTGLVYIERAILIARDLQDVKQEAWCEMQKGVIHYLQGYYPKALTAYQNGLKLAESTADKALIGNILKELGNYTKQQKEYKKAHRILARSERLCGEANDMLCLSSANSLRGVVYQYEGNLDSAEIKYQAAFDLKSELNDTLGLAYSYNDLAGIALERKQYERAIDLIQKSTTIREQINDVQGIAIDFNNIGEAYLGQENYLRALDYFEKSLVLSRELKYTDLTRYTLKLASDLSLKIGNYQLAYDYLNESSALNDSLYTVEKARTISEMQTKYETEKKQQQIVNQQLALDKNKAVIRQQQLIGLSVLSLILLIGAIGYYRFYQQRKYEREIQRLTFSEKLQSERARISRDLHDNVGASLTSIITKLDVISYKARKNDAVKISNSLEKVNQGARGTMQQLRETIWAIKKDSYSVEAFAKKIKEYLQKYLDENQTLDWNVKTLGDLNRQLSPVQVLNLFRIIQEAVQNTVKYAEASILNVTFESHDKLKIRIKDNGIGFNFSEVESEDHYGLENMEMRAKDIQGTFNLNSAKNQGVTILIEV